MGLGPRVDAAITRDNMAQVYEGQGRWDEAKEMRMIGNATNQISCGNPNVWRLSVSTCGQHC